MILYNDSSDSSESSESSDSCDSIDSSDSSDSSDEKHSAMRINLVMKQNVYGIFLRSNKKLW